MHPQHLSPWKPVHPGQRALEEDQRRGPGEAGVPPHTPLSVLLWRTGYAAPLRSSFTYTVLKLGFSHTWAKELESTDLNILKENLLFLAKLTFTTILKKDSVPIWFGAYFKDISQHQEGFRIFPAFFSRV